MAESRSCRFRLEMGIATVHCARPNVGGEGATATRARRALRFGAPLGEAHNETGQLAAMRAALGLLGEAGPPSVLRDHRVRPDA